MTLHINMQTYRESITRNELCLGVRYTSVISEDSGEAVPQRSLIREFIVLFTCNLARGKELELQSHYCLRQMSLMRSRYGEPIG